MIYANMQGVEAAQTMNKQIEGDGNLSAERSYLFSPSNLLCFSAPSPASPANGDANPTVHVPNDENEGRGEPTPVISVTRPVVGVFRSPLPSIPSDPERSSSDTSAPTRDTQKEGVRVAVEVVPMSVFDCECNCKVAELQVTV